MVSAVLSQAGEQEGGHGTNNLLADNTYCMQAESSLNLFYTIDWLHCQKKIHNWVYDTSIMIGYIR